MANDELLNDAIVFRLRSGYEVGFACDAPGMIQHLQRAIIEESLARVAVGGASSWDALVPEMVAECQYVVEGILIEMARPLLVGLLADALVARSHPITHANCPVRLSIA